MPRDRDETKPTGEEIRAARRARVRRIRRRVATGAVVSFLAAWGVVYAQMRMGDDPSLGTGSAVAQVDSSSASSSSSSGNTLATADDTSTDSTATTSDDSTASSDDSTAGNDSSTMVTSQS